MSDQAEELDVAAVRARCEAASPGPWGHDGSEITYVDDKGQCQWVGETCRFDGPAPSEANAAFIAHARIDLPAALDEIERLQTLAAVKVSRADDPDAGRRGD